LTISRRSALSAVPIARGRALLELLTDLGVDKRRESAMKSHSTSNRGYTLKADCSRSIKLGG
jgi:hypothetical protein